LVGDINGAGVADLNVVYSNRPSGWVFHDAIDINDAGQILALARDALNSIHVVVLTPSTGALAPPAAPSGLVAAATSAVQVNLRWADNADNETSQLIERCAGAGCANFAQVAIVGANANVYNDSGLTESSAFSYRIRAHNGNGDSGYDNVANATTPAATANCAPAAPTTLTAAAASSSQVSLQWVDNASNESSTTVERCRGLGCTVYQALAFLGANVTGFQDSNLMRGTSYSYRVRTSNAAGASGYSGSASALTAP
jgi:hypothetical protein